MAPFDSSGWRLHRVRGEADETAGDFVPQSQLVIGVASAGVDVDEQGQMGPVGEQL